MTTDTEQHFDGVATASRLIPLILLIGGALNGFAVRIMESVRLNGAETLLFGISPFELIIVAIAAHLLWMAAQSSDYAPGLPEVLVLGVFLIPSSALSWIGVTAYALYLAMGSTGDRRLGALLFVGLGVTALWASIFIKWFAAPITTAEAHFVAGLLLPFRGDVSVSANLIGAIGGHQILLLPACASAYLIPKAIVALAAVTIFMGAKIESRDFVKTVLVTVVVLCIANWVRLAIMTWSNDLYHLAHGPVGANAFDLVQTAIIIAAGMWASR